MFRLVLTIASLELVFCDYTCLCNYNVELPVYEKDDADSSLLGYIYEFDCKEKIEVKTLDKTWAAVAFLHQIGFIHWNSEVQRQICQGDPSEEDKIIPTTNLITFETTKIFSSATNRNPTTASLVTPVTSFKPISTHLAVSTTSDVINTSPDWSTTTNMLTQNITSTLTLLATTSAVPMTTPVSQTSDSRSTSVIAMTSSSTSMHSLSGSNSLSTSSITTGVQTTQSSLTAELSLPTITTSLSPDSISSTPTGFLQENRSNAVLNTDYSRIPLTSTSYLNSQSVVTNSITYTPTGFLQENKSNAVPNTDHSKLPLTSTSYWNSQSVVTNSQYTTDTSAKTTSSVTEPFAQASSTTPKPFLNAGILKGNTTLCKPGLLTSSHKVTQFFSHCYEFVLNSPRIWKLADIYCQIRGGTLLSIDTLIEEEYIYQVLSQSSPSTQPVWIGLSDVEEEGVFRWPNGKIADLKQMKWNNTIPMSSDADDCVLLQTYQHPAVFDDVDCDTGHDFVCKYDLVANGVAIIG